MTRFTLVLLTGLLLTGCAQAPTVARGANAGELAASGFKKAQPKAPPATVAATGLMARCHILIASDKPLTASRVAESMGLSPAQAAAFVAAADADADQAVSPAESAAWAAKAPAVRALRDAVIRPQFDAADDDLNRRLDLDEALRATYWAAQSAPGLDLTRAEFDRADANHDGFLNWDEFMPLGAERVSFHGGTDYTDLDETLGQIWFKALR